MRCRPRLYLTSRSEPHFLETQCRISSCGTRTGSGPGGRRRGVRTPRPSPPPCSRHGGGVLGSEFFLGHLVWDADGQFLLRQQVPEAGVFSSSLVRLVPRHSSQSRTSSVSYTRTPRWPEFFDGLDHRAAVVEHFLVLPDFGDDPLRVCLHATIREYPPVGQGTCADIGLLSGDPTTTSRHRRH